MGKVTDHLVSLIKRQVKDRGIVVWYDPEQVYTDVVQTLTLSEGTILRYQGSFFELREQIEPFLEFIGSDGRPKTDCEVLPKLVIYVGKEPSDVHYALVEAEATGVVMRPAADHWHRNTSLKVIAERIFKEIAPDRVNDIVRKVEKGYYNLKDLDELAERYTQPRGQARHVKDPEIANLVA
jgi:hypothetical protein